MIYFIQQGEEGPIKIGISRNPKNRLRQLQTAHAVKLRILHTMSGGNDEEHALHHRFRHLHMHGEWFRPDQDLVSHIEALRDGRRGWMKPWIQAQRRKMRPARRPALSTPELVSLTVGAAITAAALFVLYFQMGGY